MGGLDIHKKLAMIKKDAKGQEISVMQRSRFKDQNLIWSMHAHIGRTCWKFLTPKISAQNHVTSGKDSQTWPRKDKSCFKAF